MDKTEAQVRATRETLHALIKASPHTQKWVAQQIGEDPTVLSRRLTGNREDYSNLDTSLVVNLLRVLDVDIVDFYVRVKERATQISAETRRRR